MSRLFLVVFVLLMAVMAKGQPNMSKRIKCKDRNFPKCYRKTLYCPADCPNNCDIDCGACEAVCPPKVVKCKDPLYRESCKDHLLCPEACPRTCTADCANCTAVCLPLTPTTPSPPPPPIYTPSPPPPPVDTPSSPPPPVDTPSSPPPPVDNPSPPPPPVDTPSSPPPPVDNPSPPPLPIDTPSSPPPPVDNPSPPPPPVDTPSSPPPPFDTPSPPPPPVDTTSPPPPPVDTPSSPPPPVDTPSPPPPPVDTPSPPPPPVDTPSSPPPPVDTPSPPPPPVDTPSPPPPPVDTPSPPPPPVDTPSPPPPPVDTPSPPPPPVVTPSSPPTSTPTWPPPPDSSEVAAGRRVRCRNKNYTTCYYQEHRCPAACPNQCEVDCVICRPVCNCNMPGAVCQDPKFVGADGITFYFHGKKDKEFCIVSDNNLHINAHFIGRRNENMGRDFTWVQSLGILFDKNQISVGAKKTSTWDNAIDRLELSYNGLPIQLDEEEGATWTSQGTTIKRTRDVNSVVIEVEGNFKIKATVVPITKEDSIIHKYGVTDEDCLAHLDLGFKFYSLSGEVSGVLGQTYASNYVSRVKMGIDMPVLGGQREFASSSLFSTDCAASRFKGTQNSYAKNFEYANLKCGSGIEGRGVVCKR